MVPVKLRKVKKKEVRINWLVSRSWESGLIRRFQAAVPQGAWVRTPQNALFFAFQRSSKPQKFFMLDFNTKIRENLYDKKRD